MLTGEQEKTLNEACSLYLEARNAEEPEDKIHSLELFNKALNMLVEYIDEVDDIYYQIVFANCIEELQRKGNIQFSDQIVQAKVNIYVKMLSWLMEASGYKPNFKGHLFIALDALARLFLLGKENVRQNDQLARVCYLALGDIGAVPEDLLNELYLQDFVQDEATGQWKYIGVRPE